MTTDDEQFIEDFIKRHKDPPIPSEPYVPLPFDKWLENFRSKKT
jgi:hypothetical protein